MQLLDSKVRDKLSGLKTLLSLRILGEGVGWLLTALVSAVLITLVLDITLHLDDRPLRVGLMVLAIGGLLWVIWRRIILPMKVSVTTEDLALLVEKRYSSLENRLITTLQMEDAVVEDGQVSVAMIQAAASEANDLASPLAFASVIDSQRMRKVSFLAFGAVALIVAMSLIFPGTMNIWFNRNVLLANVAWPQDTYLNIFYEDGRGELIPLLDVNSDGTVRHRSDTLRVVRGGPVKLVVQTAEGSSIPGKIKLHATYPSAGDTIEELYPLPPEDKEGLVSMMPEANRSAAVGRTYYVREFASVNEPFRFYFTGGDDNRGRRNPHQVILVEPPALRNLQFEIEAPPYMRIPGRIPFDESQGSIPVPCGGKLYFTARVTKPLDMGYVVIDGEQGEELKVEQYTNPDTKSQEHFVSGSIEAPGNDAVASVRLTFRLIDSEGYENNQEEIYLVQYLRDTAPHISIKSIGVGREICSEAMIPLVVEARDKQSLTEISFYGQSRRPSEDGSEAVGIDLPANILGPPVEISTQIIKNSHNVDRFIDIKSLALPVESVVDLWAECKDNLPDYLAGPNATTSSRLNFRIVSKEDLLARLVAKQAEIRIAFFETLAYQARIRGRVTAAADEAREGKRGAETIRKISSAAEMELSVASDTFSSADSLYSVALEMEYNRLSTPEDTVRVQNLVTTPLRQVTRELHQIRLDLQAALKITDTKNLTDSLDRIAIAQDEVYQKMADIFANMRKMENKMELSRQLEKLWQISLDIDSVMREQLRKIQEDLFDEEKDNDDSDNDDAIREKLEKIQKELLEKKNNKENEKNTTETEEGKTP